MTWLTTTPFFSQSIFMCFYLNWRIMDKLFFFIQIFSKYNNSFIVTTMLLDFSGFGVCFAGLFSSSIPLLFSFSYLDPVLCFLDSLLCCWVVSPITMVSYEYHRVLKQLRIGPGHYKGWHGIGDVWVDSLRIW